MNAAVRTSLAALLSAAASASAAAAVRVESPHGAVRVTLVADGGRLAQEVRRHGAPVVDRSPLGIRVDGVDLGDGVTIGAVERYRTDEAYAWRGVHATAVDRSRGARVGVRHLATGLSYVVDVRAFDDGVAFRFVVPGAAGRRRVPDAASSFVLPAGSVVWYHGLNAGHYEDLYVRRPIEDGPERRLGGSAR